MPSPQLTLIIMDGTFANCKLPADASIPAWATAGDFYSITRTAEELSVVCHQDVIPASTVCERDWRCLRIAGPIPFSAVGILASLTVPLADAGISVFAISTFNTDYLLVKEKDLDAALDALHRHGHTIKSREPESDEGFIIRCKLPSHPRATEIALVVRRAIAAHGDFKAEMVHALDRIPENLGDIFIRESLNVVQFLMVLEEDLGIRIPDAPVIDLVSRGTVTVKEMVETITVLVVRQL
jgi:acyl carrier protein